MAFFNTKQAQEQSINEFVKILIQDGTNSADLLKKRDEYLYYINNKINFDVPFDIYMYMCDFLHFDDILQLTISNNRLYIEYYKYIWQIFQTRYFPRSLLTDYKDIIKNTSIHIYHTLKINAVPINRHSYGTLSYIDILDKNPDDYYINDDFAFIIDILQMERCENRIKVLLDENKELNNKKINYKERLITNNYQINSIYKDIRYGIFNEHNTYSFLNNFKFNSYMGLNNQRFYTIKPDIDMRLYGFDPTIKEQKIKGSIKIKKIITHNQYQIYDINEWCDYKDDTEIENINNKYKYEKFIEFFNNKFCENDNYEFPEIKDISNRFMYNI